MTNQQIIEKAIRLAIDGGWDAYGWPNWKVWGEDTVMFYDKAQEEDDTKWVRRGNELELSTIIFNHEFAKALWGEQKPLENGEYPPTVIMYKGKPVWHPWSYHLQRMVIADDPIKYLGENL